MDNLGNNSTSENVTAIAPSDYLEFTIGTAINTYGPPIITFLGTVGNILSLLVVASRRKNITSPDVYIAALAAFDLSMLWVGLFQYWILFNFFAHLITETHCHIMFFVVNFLNNCGVWIIVAMSVERFIVVIFPFKASSLCTLKKTVYTMCGLILFSVLKNFHYFWTSDFVYNPKTKAALCAFGMVRKGVWVQVVQWLDTCLSSLIPFAVICATNTAIIIAIRKQSRYIRSMSDSKASSSDSGTTVMLVCVSLTFVLLTCPLFIFRTAFTFIERSSPYLLAAYHLGHHTCHKLWYTNNAVNFYLYCITGQSFRRDLKGIFSDRSLCKCFEDGGSSQSPGAHSSSTTLDTVTNSSVGGKRE